MGISQHFVDRFPVLKLAVWTVSILWQTLEVKASGLIKPSRYRARSRASKTLTWSAIKGVMQANVAGLNMSKFISGQGKAGIGELLLLSAPTLLGSDLSRLLRPLRRLVDRFGARHRAPTQLPRFAPYPLSWRGPRNAWLPGDTWHGYETHCTQTIFDAPQELGSLGTFGSEPHSVQLPS